MPEVHAAITGDSIYTLNDSLKASDEAALIAETWIAGADLGIKEQDIFRGLESSGPEAVIETEAATRGINGGLTAIYRMMGEFGNSPRTGSQTFKDEDYEGVKLGTDSVAADWFRFATSKDERASAVLGMREDLSTHTNELQGRQMGRLQTHNLCMTMLHTAPSDNRMYPSGVYSQRGLRADHTLSWSVIEDMQAMMAPLGGTPFQHATDEQGNDIRRYLAIPTVSATIGLKRDPVYRANVQQAGARGKENCLFYGGFPLVDSTIIREWNVQDLAGAVTIGSPFNPKAWLGKAVTAGTSSLDLFGGGIEANAEDAQKEYFQFFPLHDYILIARKRLNWSKELGWELNAGGRFYVTVTNPNKGVDPGKYNIYEISANDGNKLTVHKRLGPANAGIDATTVGDLTWDSDVHTQEHPEGSLIYLSNESGTALGATPMLGARAARRAWGPYRLALTTDKEEGGFVLKNFIASVFGHALRRDLDGRVPGVVILKHAIEYPGWRHPRPLSVSS